MTALEKQAEKEFSLSDYLFEDSFRELKVSIENAFIAGYEKGFKAAEEQFQELGETA